MRDWLIQFRIFWSKTLFADIQFIHKSSVRPSKSVAKERAVHYWKYNYQLHHKNAGYLSIPTRFVVVSETALLPNAALPAKVTAGKFHPVTSNTVSGNMPPSYA